MANYDSNYAIAQEISARIGTSPIPFDSVYSIALNIYNELGGEPAEFDSVYSILLGILPLVEGGIASKVIDDNSIASDKTWSSSKLNALFADIDAVTDVKELPDEYLNKNKIVRYEKNLYYIKPKGINAIQITALSGTPYISVYRKSTSTLVEHSYDGVEWNETSLNDTYNLAEGQSIYFRGIVNADSAAETPVNLMCIGEGTVKASGNINAMVNYKAGDLGADFNLTYTGCLRNLFFNSKALVDISELYLPSLHLTDNCYEGMFDSCYNLTGKLPQLPATELATKCYKNMYTDCMSITDASELILPAKFVSNRGYQNMFSMINVAPAGKSSQLTKSPIICATNMNDERCAYGMFNNCTNLSEITCLATDISGTKTTDNFSKSVAANGVFHKASSMNDWTIGVNGIPDGWTIDDATEPEYKYDWTGLYEWMQIATEAYVDDAIAEIPQLEAGENIVIADNKINADGYIYDETQKTFFNVAKMTSQSLINKFTENGNKMDSTAKESTIIGSRNVIENCFSMQNIFGKGNTSRNTGGAVLIAGIGMTYAKGNTSAIFGINSNILNEYSVGINQIAVGNDITVSNNYECAFGKYNVSHTGTSLSIGDGIGAMGTTAVKRNLIEVMNNNDIYVRGVGGYDGVHIKTDAGYENTKTLQEYIASLEARIAALENPNA